MLAATAPPRVWLRNWYGTYGADGAVSIARNRSFAAVVKPPMRFDSVGVPGGHHSWTTFETLMPAYFAFFTRALDKPTGAASRLTGNLTGIVRAARSLQRSPRAQVVLVDYWNVFRDGAGYELLANAVLDALGPLAATP